MNARVAYSPDEAANLAHVGRTTLYMEIKAGRLRARKIGRKTLILAEDLLAYLRNLPDREPCLPPEETPKGRAALKRQASRRKRATADGSSGTWTP